MATADPALSFIPSPNPSPLQGREQNDTSHFEVRISINLNFNHRDHIFNGTAQTCFHVAVALLCIVFRPALIGDVFHVDRTVFGFRRF